MTDLAEWKVRGPVRTLRREFAEWDPANEAWQAPRGVTVVTFRPDGQLSEAEFHNPNGSVARRARAYDEVGRLVGAEFWSDGGPRSRIRYYYDAAGRSSRTVNVTPDGTEHDVETCHYDDAGRKTKVQYLAVPRPNTEISYAVEGTEHAFAAPGATTSTVVYDDRELPAEVTFHDANHAIVRRIVLSRDGDGHLMTEAVYFGGEAFADLPAAIDDAPAEERVQLAALLANVFADRTFSTTTYRYDEVGRLQERTMRMGSLSEERTTFRYDDKDNPIEEISESHSRDIHLDDAGAVQAREEEPRVRHVRFEYQYDAQGNWTEQTVWIRTDSQLEYRCSNIERRAITYYEN